MCPISEVALFKVIYFNFELQAYAGRDADPSPPSNAEVKNRV